MQRPIAGIAPAPEGGADPPARASGPDDRSVWQRNRLQEIQATLSRPGLLARPALLHALGGAIRQSVATGMPAAMLLIDLNKFAEINAAWGVSGGDEALAAAGARIEAFAAERLGRSASGAAAAAGRLDADHFAAIVPDVASFESLRREAAALIRELAQPFALFGQAIALSARCVIVQIPLHGRSVTSVLGRGFQLLNTAARASADGVALSVAEARGASTIMLERDLAAALSTDQLFIALQPKVDAVTGAVQGAEALARWRHPERGMLPPPLFIATAEKSGLIFDLGLRILRDACRAGNRLAADGQALNIAVNVSPHQLTHPDFLSRFLEVIDRERVEPETLQIEVTETAAMMGGERISENLQALRRCGIGVGIDDFGTGFSNLASLASLPADTLKIDRSLVAFNEGDRRSEALLGIAVQLARTFGMKTVAEGVETETQLDRVRQLGCDYVQGYLTGRPVNARDFSARYLENASLPTIDALSH